MRKADSEKRKDFERAFKPAGVDENQRLGLGHPLIDAPRAKGSGVGKGPGFGALGERLKKREKDKGKGEIDDCRRAKEKDGDSEEAEQEESRSLSVGKARRKLTHPNLLLGRKRFKHSGPLGSPSISEERVTKHDVVHLPWEPASLAPCATERAGARGDSGGDDGPPKKAAATSQTPPSPRGSGDFPVPGAVALDSPRVKRILAGDPTKASSTDDGGGGSMDNTDGERGEGEEVGKEGSGEKMSKSQRRREKRKRQKTGNPKGTGG